MEERIGFIGLGNMGAPMAKNLLKVGYKLTVFDVVADKMEPLAKDGAKPAASAAELAAESDYIITILPKDEHIIQAYEGAGGILENIRGGAVCIEMTTALGRTVVDIREKADALGKNIEFLDAPVSGGVAGAVNAALTIMCGGSRETFERCKKILEAMGKKIFYTGGVGSGKSIKMINQLLNAGNTLVAAEAIYLARRLGLDLGLLHSVVKESSGNSWVYENNVTKFMAPKQYEGGFRLDLMKKDIGLALDSIQKENLDMPLSSMIYQILQDAESLSGGDKNYNVAGEWIERNNR